jgi:hypothetical protein
MRAQRCKANQYRQAPPVMLSGRRLLASWQIGEMGKGLLHGHLEGDLEAEVLLGGPVERLGILQERLAKCTW